MAGFGQFTGNTIGEAAAFAAGLAIAPLLEPVLQELRNTTWSEAPTRPLDPATVAGGVAERKISPATGRREASFTGISTSAFDDLVLMMQKSPAIAEGIRLIRRGQLAPADFPTVLQRAGLEDEFITAYEATAHNGLRPWEQPLDPAVIALGIVRDTIPDPGLQVGAHDTSGSDIPQGDQFQGNVLEEFAAAGVTEDRARVMVQNIGLPMPPVRAASANFRGIINKESFYLSVAQSDSRPAWADAIYEEARQISTAHDAVENHLRGYSQASDMYDRAARHGMRQADVDILFQNAGRPLTVHQITTGLARGGVFNPETNELTDPYEASVHESNIKPSYYDLAIANRYSYPSLFQLNALVKANAITADTAADWATKDGLAPEVVTALHTFWSGEQAGGGGTTGTKPKQYTYSQIHSAWSHSVFTDAQALTELQALGYSAEKATTLLDTWKVQAAASTK